MARLGLLNVHTDIFYILYLHVLYIYTTIGSIVHINQTKQSN